MYPLIWLGIAIAGGFAIHRLTKKKFEPSEESNCNEEFLIFEQRLSISPSKRKQLIASRNAVQKKIRDYFRDKPGMPVPTFYIQGSYKQGTIIRKQNDTCDVDVGVYFDKKPILNPLTIQKHIAQAIGSHTMGSVKIKSKCVRVFYANNFHIDFPIYYYKSDQYYIGIGGGEWRKDDPKLFTNWLVENTKDNYQKIRIIKYFKAWADMVKTKLGQKMPCGLALTIWALTHFEENEREDLALLNTARSLLNALQDGDPCDWECYMPTTPHDSVIDKLNEDQRENFLQALDNLVENCTRTVCLDSKEECLQEWKLVFGKWF
jgi:hypothetical protein